MDFLNTARSLHAAVVDGFAFTPSLLVLALLLILVIVLVGISIRNIVVMRQLAYPVYDYAMKKAEDEAEKIVRDASAHARDIRARAEADVAALLKERKTDAESLHTHYEQQLRALAENNTKLLEHYSIVARDSFRGFEKSVKSQAESSTGAVKEEIERLLADLKEEHANLRRHFAQQFHERLEGELAATKETVAAYREAQLRLIDKRIIALVERAAALTFQKELSVQEHTDIIFQSLEEAKKEGVL